MMINMADKWVEVNIHLNNYTRANEAIADVVKNLVEKFKSGNLIKSWHFFREPQIRLRFFGEEDKIEKVKQMIDDCLKDLESSKGDLYSCHVFGSHGIRGKEYTGEDDFWDNDWSLVMKLWEQTSEFVLALISGKPCIALDVHGERHVHLFLNQLGLAHTYVDTSKEKIIQYRRQKKPDE